MAVAVALRSSSGGRAAKVGFVLAVPERRVRLALARPERGPVCVLVLVRV
jgi:hypothetical protein